MHRRLVPLGLLLTAASLAACDPAEPTYYADAKAVIDARCATCHRPGDIGPFSLTSYDEVAAFAGPVRASIANGTMPPWQPSDDCNDYQGNIDLTPEEAELLLAWLDGDLPEGDPGDAPDDFVPDEPFATDISLELPEAYTPEREPDDYRCQLIEWPGDELRYVTGLRVTPDQRAIVHHVIVFLIGPDQVEQFRAFDDAEAGPGYTCYGGPTGGEGGSLGDLDQADVVAAAQALGIPLSDLIAGDLTPEQAAALMQELGVGDSAGFASLGSWVPGQPERPLPEGTGIAVEPGSMLVVQMHYNTSTSDPVADRSRVEIATAAEVDRPATNMPIVDIGWLTNGALGEAMSIPAGDASVQHSTTVDFDSMFTQRARQSLGLGPDAPLVLHSANLHMHELGTEIRTDVLRADGGETCLVDLPEWDFNWQGAYTFAEPVSFRPGDALRMGCTWDNSAANQPVVDGEVRAPADVVWGEGTEDEMCLGSFYVTAE